MANPTPVSYTGQAGKPIAAGRVIYPHATLDLIAAAPENSWVYLNANLYSDAWGPAGLRISTNPRALIRAWSSFAWDAKRHGFWLWGGGHANYSGNEVYFWSAMTRQWSLAFHMSQVARNSADVIYRDIDPSNQTPLSSHTYDNNIFLPIVDRFLTFGGAQQGDGSKLRVWSGETALRAAACYTLQPELAGKGFLGGRSGDNYQGAGHETTILPGANAWQLRDWFLSTPTVADSHINGGTCYREEGGLDVVYYLAGSSTSRGVYRAVFNTNWQDDTYALVCSGSNDAGGGQGAVGLDTVRNVIFYPLRPTQAALAQFCDLKTNPTRQWQHITAFGGDAGAVAAFLAGYTVRQGVDYDPIRDHFVMWEKGPNVWAIKPPEGNPTPTTGWTVTKLNVADAPAPIDVWLESQSGTHGKWKYAPDLDCFIGMINPNEGHVWAFKPAGWQDPRI